MVELVFFSDFNLHNESWFCSSRTDYADPIAHAFALTNYLTQLLSGTPAQEVHT